MHVHITFILLSFTFPALIVCVCVFDSEFLVKFLEQQVCGLGWDVGFVTFTMLEIGVQLPRLLEVYDQLFKTRVWLLAPRHPD